MKGKQLKIKLFHDQEFQVHYAHFFVTLTRKKFIRYVSVLSRDAPSWAPMRAPRGLYSL